MHLNRIGMQEGVVEECEHPQPRRHEKTAAVVLPPVFDRRDQWEGGDRGEQGEEGDHRPRRWGRCGHVFVMICVVGRLGSRVIVGTLRRLCMLSRFRVLALGVRLLCVVGSMFVGMAVTGGGHDRIAACLWVAEHGGHAIEGDRQHESQQNRSRRRGLRAVVRSGGRGRLVLHRVVVR